MTARCQGDAFQDGVPAVGRRGVSANRRRRWSNQRRPASVGPPGRQENGRRVAGSADQSQSVSESNRVRQQCEQRRPRAHRPNTLTHPHASTPTLGHTDSTTPRPTRRNDDQPKMAHVRAANNGSLFGARKLTQEDRAELLEQFQSVSTRSTLVSASVRHFFCCFGRPSVDHRLVSTVTRVAFSGAKCGRRIRVRGGPFFCRFHRVTTPIGPAPFLVLCLDRHSKTRYERQNKTRYDAVSRPSSFVDRQENSANGLMKS